MTRQKNKFPLWFKMVLTLIPAIGMLFVLWGLASGNSISPIIVGTLAVMVTGIIKMVLGAPIT